MPYFQLFRVSRLLYRLHHFLERNVLDIGCLKVRIIGGTIAENFRGTADTIPEFLHSLCEIIQTFQIEDCETALEPFTIVQRVLLNFLEFFLF